MLIVDQQDFDWHPRGTKCGCRKGIGSLVVLREGHCLIEGCRLQPDNHE